MLKIISLIKLQPVAWNFIKKETVAQVFSCEFCKIFKNNFSYRTSPVAASESNWDKAPQTFTLCPKSLNEHKFIKNFDDCTCVSIHVHSR